MTQPDAGAFPDWSALQHDVRDIEQRLARIEAALHLAPERAAEPQPSMAAQIEPSAAVPQAAALLPLAGRGLLGLAGAFLLRALTESSVLAPGVGVALGMLYAALWLIYAARIPAEKRLDTAIYSMTSALVMAPLLWEATLRFHVLSTWSAAGILFLFTVFGLTVSWRKNLLVAATIAMLAGIGTASGLLFVTHDVLPFTFFFLATAAAVEISACLDHWLSERWLAAAAADLSVLLATWLVTKEYGLPASYAPIPYAWLLAAQAALLGIYLSSVIFRTLLRGRTFTIFETLQCAGAFVIGVGGGLRVSHYSTAIAAVSLVCALACYLVAFARLDHAGRENRNFFTYSTFGLLLALAGARILFTGLAAAAVWSALALACLWAAGRFGRVTLQAHGGAYLWIALATGGALQSAGSSLLATDAGGSVPPALCLAALLAAACYALVWRRALPDEGSAGEIWRLCLAAAAVWVCAGTLASVLTAAYHAAWGLAATHTPTAPPCERGCWPPERCC